MLRKSSRTYRNLPRVNSSFRTLNFQPLETRRLLAGAGEPTLPDGTTASIYRGRCWTLAARSVGDVWVQ